MENSFRTYSRGLLARARAKYSSFDVPGGVSAVLAQKVSTLEMLASGWRSGDDSTRRLFLLRLAEMAALAERAACDLELLELLEPQEGER